MKIAKRSGIRVLSRRAVGLLAALGSAGVSAQTQQVVIVGSKFTSYANFDPFMTTYFSSGPMSDWGFSPPEAEAYTTEYGNIIVWNTSSGIKHITIDVCSADPRITPSTRDITRDSEDLERRAAANQVAFAMYPNLINTRRDALTMAMRWGDGSSESFRHTSMSGWLPNGEIQGGTGVARSACGA